MTLHTTATWPSRSDRRPALVWLALFWIFVGVGFGFDLHNYLHEKPAVPTIVHVHAVLTTGWLLIASALVLLVESGNVALHRTLGWFAAGFAGLVIVIAPWSELSWQALNLTTPGDPPPSFLALAFSGIVCMAILLAWGLRLRRNPAAHRRVLMLAIVCISDAGFARMASLFAPERPGFLNAYLHYEGGNLLLLLLMFLWDWKQNRVMTQFVYAAGIILAVTLAGTALYESSTWNHIAEQWLIAWAKHMP